MNKQKSWRGVAAHRSAADEEASNRLATTVADRLVRLITRKGRSLERIAELSGIEIDELLQIKAGSMEPTITHLWRIANALDVPFGSLVASKERSGVLVMRNGRTRVVGSRDGNFLSRPLFPYDCRRAIEFYQITLAPGHFERAEAHAPGTKEKSCRRERLHRDRRRQGEPSTIGGWRRDRLSRRRSS